MRKVFVEKLFSKMLTNPDIYVITGDLGYGLWDTVRDNFPNRFFNVGSSEMVMMGMAVGLANDNKIPFVYSITPFAIYRPFEVIRNYLDHEKVPVKVVGGGRGKDYGYLGFSHWAEEDREVVRTFKNIKSFWPEDQEEVEDCLNYSLENRNPVYINLSR